MPFNDKIINVGKFRLEIQEKDHAGNHTIVVLHDQRVDFVPIQTITRKSRKAAILATCLWLDRAKSDFSLAILKLSDL